MSLSPTSPNKTETQKTTGALWPTNMTDIKTNLISGFVIFLVALPLSIGIAVASGAPPSAGILSAILGGIVCSLVSGSFITISGPAAGLIVVILDSVLALGGENHELGFRLTLAAIVIAGLIQVGMGLAKLGNLALAVPVNALHGMLAAIGVTIMTKQFFVLEGIAPKEKTTFLQIFEIPGRMMDSNLEIMMIGLICLATVIVFNRFPKINKIIPAPLAAVVVGYVLSYIIDIDHPHEITLFHKHFQVGPKYLLHVPENVKDYLTWPLFTAMSEFEFWKSVFTIALVASIESLLSTYAVDKLDPKKRVSNLNMDLISKGLCNTALGLIGGLPVISEIVRSSANVTNGATSRWSNLFHGVFILIFVLLFTFVLNHIPLTAFSAVLIFVGFRLAHPRQLVHVYHAGLDQLAIFVTTLLVTLNTDLLVGIFVGTALKFVITLYRLNWKFSNLFGLHFTLTKEGERKLISVESPCVFANMLKLKNEIAKSTEKEIVVRFEAGSWADYSSKEILMTQVHQMSLTLQKVELLGLDLSQNLAHH